MDISREGLETYDLSGDNDHLPFFRTSARYVLLDEIQKTSTELSLLYCGWEACRPNHRFGPNERSSYVLHIIKSGQGTLTIGGKHYRLAKGDAFLISPKEHAWYEADENDPWTYMWVGFTGIKSKFYMETAGFLKDVPYVHLNQTDIIEKYITQMIETKELSYENELIRNANLMLVFAEFIKEYAHQSPKNTSYQPLPFYVKKAMEYIEANYQQAIKITEVADYVGINRSYLANIFQKAKGCSTQEYLMSIRMENATVLLKNTSQPINEISRKVGYMDQLAFSKIFKKYYGISPRKYRQTHQHQAGL